MVIVQFDINTDFYFYLSPRICGLLVAVMIEDVLMSNKLNFIFAKWKIIL
jgi:hypothetical protein